MPALHSLVDRATVFSDVIRLISSRGFISNSLHFHDTSASMICYFVLFFFALTTTTLAAMIGQPVINRRSVAENSDEVKSEFINMVEFTSELLVTV